MSKELIINNYSKLSYELFSVSHSDWEKILHLKIQYPDKKLNEVIKVYLLDKFKIYH